MGIDSSLAIIGTVVTLLNTLIILAALGLGIYAFILFVKLAKRGIKALDIYIDKNGKKNDRLVEVEHEREI